MWKEIELKKKNHMILKHLKSDHPDIPAVKKLFEEAFPENERTMSMDVSVTYLDKLPCDLPTFRRHLAFSSRNRRSKELSV